MKDVGVEQWKQANKVYIKLLDLTVGDAISQLHGMSVVSDDVKSLVLALISSGNQSSQFFNQQIGASFEQPGWQESLLKAGDELAEYQIITELGHGGMASVYQAHRKGAEKQKSVAIKVFNRTQLTPILLNRFAVEQDILSGLSHPNIVNMHHGGSSESGMPYIVMDLIDEAQDIDDYCRTNEVGQIEIVEFIIAAAHAIAYAHQNLIVHRDIKPSNLLIDGNHQLKVVDFGIAKLMGQQDAPQKTTILALTPSFAAPEQINSGQISVTTDVFSLAAVLLSLLIKKLPLPENRLLKSCVDDETHIWQLLKSNIEDRDLRNILNQALQQDPHKRYRNMDLFAEDLTAWIARKPVQATPDSWTYRITKFAQRRRALFAALSTLLVMVVLGIILLSWQVEKTQAEARKAYEVKNFMINVFSVAHPDVSQGKAVSALDLLQKARVDIELTYQSDSKLKSELLFVIGTALYQVGDWQQAKETLAEAYELEKGNTDLIFTYLEVLADLQLAKEAKSLYEYNLEMLVNAESSTNQSRLLRLQATMANFNDQYDESYQLLNEAYEVDKKNLRYGSLVDDVIALVKLSYLRSQYKDGIALAEDTLKQYQNQFPLANTKILQLKNELSILYTKTGQFAKSQLILEEMVAIEKEYLGDEHPDLIQSMISLSESYYSQGNLEEAHKMAQEAHDLTLLKFGEGHPKLIESINGLASVVFIQGDYEQALALMKQAIGISENKFSFEHAETLKLKRNYATALSALKRNEESRDVLLEVLELQKQTIGAEHNDTLYTQISLVRTLGALGQNDQAVILAEQAIEIVNTNYELNEPIRSNAQFALGFAYFDAKRFQDAIDAFKKIEAMESNETANYMVMCQTMAESYLAIRDYKNAEAYANKSLELSNKLVGPDHMRTTKLKLILAEILTAAGKFNASNKLLTESKVSVLKSDDRKKQNIIDQIKDLVDRNQQGGL